MLRYIEKAEKLSLPVVALNGLVAFPAITVSFEISEPMFMAAANIAINSSSLIFLVTPSQISDEKLTSDKFFKVGTVAKIKQSIKTPEGNMRVIAEGVSRAAVSEYKNFAEYITADVICKTVSLRDEGNVRSEAYILEAITALENIKKFLPAVSADIINTAKTIRSVGLLADFIASNIFVKYQDKQTILECFEPYERIETLIILLEQEKKLLSTEFDIHQKVRARINRHQREYYLREQIHVIQDELGEGINEADEYESKIISAKLPKEVTEKLLKENERMSKTPFGSAEGGVLRNYLDTCLELPWSKKTKDRLDIANAKKILDSDHDGLTKIKERILEFLAVKQLNPELKNQIICLVGPPGVGKTSIAASIARSMKRKYVRVSLGGVRDEADIRGHRKTYIGAMPGRIINALIQAKSNNPLILLDEIDKLTSDAHGDPTSALLEVLDSEQNKSFRDHFVELPFDLSDCLFIATANTLETVPRPLIDRMEIIELNTYSKNEKLQIAKNHLIPKQLKRHGLTRRTLQISEDAIIEIIDYYTREAGVRNLERKIGELCRKAAKKIIETNISSIKINAQNLSEFLNHRQFFPELIGATDEIGTVNGLAFTEVGGDLLKIEAAVLDGNGKVELTGSLGDVMKESAQAAISYIRSIASKMNIPSDFYQKKDIHIHVPEGAVPKDGPSAGITIMTALVSALTGRPVKHDIAMTGEITLLGNVLPIGGLKEKTMAAYTAGVKSVIIPFENVKDLDDIDQNVRNSLNFIPCKKASEVLEIALCDPILNSTLFSVEQNEKNGDKAQISDIPTTVSGISTTLHL